MSSCWQRSAVLNRSTKLGVTLETVVMTYLMGGVVAGAIVGALLPLRRTAIGASFVGFVAAVPVWMGIFYAGGSGSPLRWDSSDWEGVVVISLAFGIAGGRMLRKELDHCRHRLPRQLRYANPVDAFFLLLKCP